MANLFAKVNTTGQIPEQWKVSKIIPTFKEGNKTEQEKKKEEEKEKEQKLALLHSFASRRRI